jgi:diaminopimelate epimerase
VLKKIDFVKGHMGGNEIILLYGDQIPEGKLAKIALSVLDPPNIGGHEAGIFYKSKGYGHLRAKIIGRSSRRFISMCGGLTQVLGRALIETDFAEYFNIKITDPVTEIILETDAGFIRLKIESPNGKFKRVWTNMKPFVDECYELGVQPIKVAYVDAMKVGKFLVVNGDDVKKRYVSVDFEKMDELTLQTLKKIQESFNEQRYMEQRNVDFALYDLHPQYSGKVRAVFPHNISGGHIEPACGTGTVAIGIAMAERGNLKDLEIKNGVISIPIESGGGPEIGGPDITELRVTVKNGKVIDADFSHSLVEVIAIGKCFLNT